MPRIILIERKQLILEDETTKIQKLLNNSLIESGLIKESTNKVDKEEFLGGDKHVRDGILNHIIILYENISDTSAGGHQRILPQQKYHLDAPAYKLREAYTDYLTLVFNTYVTPKNAEKIDEKTADGLIDNEHVYIREILLRLFTAAISIDKNNSMSVGEAKKIIDCLEVFLKKINKTDVLYDKSWRWWSSSVSTINIAFASEHKEWIYLLREMQGTVENMHKHTASISKLLEVLHRVKTTIALQLIAYLSPQDMPKEELLSGWIKYTLLKCEMAFLKQNPKDTLSLCKDASENYNTMVVNQHQQALIQNKKTFPAVSNLYALLTKTNKLLAVLDQIDILISTTGWVLIISDVLNLSNLSKLIENYSQEVVKTLRFDPNTLGKEKKEIIKSLIEQDALSGIDFQQNLNIAMNGIKQIESGIIKNCIMDIIKIAIGDLKSLQDSLECEIVNAEKIGLFSAHHLENKSTLLLATESKITTSSSDLNSLFSNSSTKKITLERFNKLVDSYEEEHTWKNKTSKTTINLFATVRKARNDLERANIISTYMSIHKTNPGRFYEVLKNADKHGLLFTSEIAKHRHPSYAPVFYHPKQKVLNNRDGTYSEQELLEHNYRIVEEVMQAEKQMLTKNNNENNINKNSKKHN